MLPKPHGFKAQLPPQRQSVSVRQSPNIRSQPFPLARRFLIAAPAADTAIGAHMHEGPVRLAPCDFGPDGRLHIGALPRTTRQHQHDGTATPLEATPAAPCSCQLPVRGEDDPPPAPPVTMRLEVLPPLPGDKQAAVFPRRNLPSLVALGPAHVCHLRKAPTPGPSDSGHGTLASVVASLPLLPDVVVPDEIKCGFPAEHRVGAQYSEEPEGEDGLCSRRAPQSEASLQQPAAVVPCRGMRPPVLC